MTKKVLRKALDIASGQVDDFLVYGVLHEGGKRQISKFCDYGGLIRMLNMSFELGVLNNLRVWEKDKIKYRLMNELELKTICETRYEESSRLVEKDL